MQTIADLLVEYAEAYRVAYRWLLDQIGREWEAALAATCCPLSRMWRDLRAEVDAAIVGGAR